MARKKKSKKKKSQPKKSKGKTVDQSAEKEDDSGTPSAASKASKKSKKASGSKRSKKDASSKRSKKDASSKESKKDASSKRSKKDAGSKRSKKDASSKRSKTDASSKESKKDAGSKESKKDAGSKESKKDEPAIDLDLDAEAEPGDDVSELVADVAGADAVIDEDLDESLDDSEDLDALIAATVAGADPEDDVEEVPVVSLEDEPGAETLDVEVEASEPRPYPEAQDAADEAIVTTGPSEAVEAEASPTDGPETQGSDAAEEAPASSEEDLYDAIDLGEGSSPEIRDRLLAQTLAHAEMQEARYRVPYADPRGPSRWKGAVASLLFLAAAVVAVAPPSWVRPEPPAGFDAPAQARSLRSALLIQAQQVDAFRVRNQRLPDGLDELSVALPGVRYVRSGNRSFQLIAYQSDGSAIVYDSTNPAPEFERLTPQWLGVMQ